MKALMLPAVVALAGAASCETDGAARMADVASARSAPAVACDVTGKGRALPDEMRETSGLAQSRRSAGVLWTHNDAGGEPVLFAVDTGGGIAGKVRVQGATHVDWEDMDAGPCGDADCLYVGDTGDNDGNRKSITIYALAEPAPGAGETAEATAFHARYPDGAWDSEAFFVLPTGDIYVLTKGRRGPIALYRFPAARRAGATATLERVRELWPEPKNAGARVTAASATPDGRWVAIRTYETLYLYRAAQLVGSGAAEPVTVDLKPLKEPQGEAVTIGDDGTVWLSSEAVKKNDTPTLSRLTCRLGG